MLYVPDAPVGPLVFRKYVPARLVVNWMRAQTSPVPLQELVFAKTVSLASRPIRAIDPRPLATLKTSATYVLPATPVNRKESWSPFTVAKVAVRGAMVRVKALVVPTPIGSART